MDLHRNRPGVLLRLQADGQPPTLRRQSRPALTAPDIQAVLAAQAAACADLGSPFTARVLRAAADCLRDGGAVADRLRAWPGDPTSRGDAVALRLAGGLHTLALDGRDTRLAALYAAPGAAGDGALRDAVAAALDRHTGFLLAHLDSAPQTNEVQRSAALIAVAAWLAARFDRSLVLSELGASAGLNLLWDVIALDLPGRRIGPADAALTLRPEWRGPLPPAAHLAVAARAGVDLNPLDPVADRTRILAYIWADQAARLARTRTSLGIAARLRPRIDRGDAAPWLEARLARPQPGRLHVVFHTIAWQYFPADVQARCRSALQAAGARATDAAPLAHVGIEADDEGPGAGLRARIWPGGAEVLLARVDFHGRWVDWRSAAAI